MRAGRAPLYKFERAYNVSPHFAVGASLPLCSNVEYFVSLYHRADNIGNLSHDCID